MGNRKKNKNKQKNNSNTKKVVTPTDSQKKDIQEPKGNTAFKTDSVEKIAENGQQNLSKVPTASSDTDRKAADETDKTKDTEKKGNVKKENDKKDAARDVRLEKEIKTKTNAKTAALKKDGVKLPEDFKVMAVKAAKILLPAAACIIIIAVIISYAGSRNTKAVESTVRNTQTDESAAWLDNNPLEENAHSEINELMNTFYKALADGDMDTVKTLKDFNSDKEIITYEKKSEFVESYDDIKCYTKAGVSENTYFVYVTYAMKAPGIETKAPGLEAWYVYKTEDGSLKIVGRDDMEESVLAACMLITNQDDVVDLYRKVDVSYDEALASDSALETFMNELRGRINTSVGEALAKLEEQGSSAEDVSQTEEQQTSGEEQTQQESETADESEEIPQNQTVNQTVRTTDTVNVRSSDSEEADRIGKAQAGTELTRIEERVNGWSKVVFEGREAYIKSDYLEIVASAETVQPTEPVGKITALTNVNIRSEASQESTKLGTAQAGNSYDLLEDKGEWFMISYNGSVGYVKAEFFER